MYFHKKTLRPYIDQGLITERAHQEAPQVRIYNYTAQCQYAKAWDEVTMRCRGLILDTDQGIVLANPFPKFFNLGEMPVDLPADQPYITEKVDGSLGIVYWLHNQPWVATRGSFESEQALWATAWLREQVNTAALWHDVTYLVEIVYPANRIVVKYDFSGCVLLAARATKSGRDLAPFLPCAGLFPYRAKEIPSADLNTLARMDTPNSEGFVVHWPRQDLRVKIKFPEYVRLHRILTGLSVLGIWETLSQGQSLQALLDHVPDEFYRWVTQTVADMTHDFRAVEAVARANVDQVKALPTRKEQALVLTSRPYASVAFAMLDGKNYAPIIWKMLRPKNNQAFRMDIDA